MKKLIVLVFLATPALACNAFYTGEAVSGMNKICYYDHLGSAVAVTFRAYDVCPITITVAH